MKSKDRAYLRSIATNIEPIFQIGKGNISENLIKQVDDALEARELIKITVLENCSVDAKEAAEILGKETNSVVVQVMGRKITLYRRREKIQKLIFMYKTLHK